MGEAPSGASARGTRAGWGWLPPGETPRGQERRHRSEGPVRAPSSGRSLRPSPCTTRPGGHLCSRCTRSRGGEAGRGGAWRRAPSASQRGGLSSLRCVPSAARARTAGSAESGSYRGWSQEPGDHVKGGRVGISATSRARAFLFVALAPSRPHAGSGTGGGEGPPVCAVGDGHRGLPHVWLPQVAQWPSARWQRKRVSRRVRVAGAEGAPRLMKPPWGARGV